MSSAAKKKARRGARKPTQKKKKATTASAAAKRARKATRKSAARIGRKAARRPKAASRPKARPARTKKARRTTQPLRVTRGAKAPPRPARPKGPRAQDVLEQGINALYSKDYSKARGLFEKVLSNFQEDLEVSDRARNYLKIVKSRESATPSAAKPQTADDLVDTGVLYHNQQNYEKAIEYFNAALRKKPEADYIFFALASTYSRMGDTESALRHLKKAIELDPRNRILARNDPDFESLRVNSEFAGLIGVESTDGPEGQSS